MGNPIYDSDGSATQPDGLKGSTVVEPYYQDDSVTLYHGDCREIVPGLSADVLLTDPPYSLSVEQDHANLPGQIGRAHV